MHTRQERFSVEDFKTVLAVWVRGKTCKMVGERSRRIEEVKAENDAGIVPPFRALSLQATRRTIFTKIRVRHDKVFLLDVKCL